MGGEISVLQLQSISKAFGKQEVLKDISLNIPKGKIFGIVGASGSGKSTLLKILTGNLLPDKGDVLFEPKNVANYSLFEPAAHLQSIHKNVTDLKRTVGYSAQDPSFYDKLTCDENLDFFGSTYAIPKEILKVNKQILLKLVGLESSKDKLARDLSGGMQKRLDLACALVHDPQILVLDEPTADLDFLLREQMWDLIQKIKQKGTSVIMSSHFLEEIEGICDQIIILNNSKIQFQGSPEELKKKEDAGLVIKVRVIEKNYDKVISVIKKKHKQAKITIHKNTGFLIIAIPVKKNHDDIAISILSDIKKLKQKITDFTYTKEGISEVFQKIHQMESSSKELLQKAEENVESSKKVSKIKGGNK